ncbi:serine/threonine protein kinase [Microbispora rosea subsp. aerata]|nr:protein kinase family protein [Microbispora rosea]GGO25189.1 serine/threonine protein kinase [Microbispora rosea subsp. aerata]GIH58160.1 serine/threonine protein kinase [Microbispora rosea subsp. aerata]GLJ85238.1 serine/threonine protein kinase [Microbispora rosea subsp. aerata]
MSMSTVEPGTRLADRFRLEDRVHESGGATLWKAVDEVLARPVAVHTFAPDFPRVHEVVTAARLASRLTDPRLTQVFDAADEDDTAYVVSEWVSGESLLDLLESGPIEPERGAALVAEAAEALAHAHEAGLTHLHLTPARLVWTSGGTVKLLGLAVDAAILDLSSEEPAREDAEGLGRLLYAALTGHWPGDSDCGLPPAPMDDGKVCTPRQVTAGVPGYLDAITCRALLQEPRRGQPPLATPADVAEALAEVPRPAPAPVTTAPPALNLRNEAPDGMGMPTMPPQLPPQMQMVPPPRQQTGTASKILLTVIVLLVMAAVGVGAWTVGKNLGNTPRGVAQPDVTTSPSPSRKPVAVKPVSATGFDPLGSDREEKPEYAPLAIDGKSSTDWHTDSYTSADLGRLKDGVGLILDMGKPIPIADVVVSLGDRSGATVQLKVGDAAELSSLKTVAEKKGASGSVTLTPEKETTGQYVLIWFTRLPPYNGQYRGTIYEVTVHSPGSA